MNSNHDESKFVQQHLANERTFLAWIRTTISIMGVGFLTTSLYFELSTSSNATAELLIKFVGYTTLFLGFLSLSFSIYSYLDKRKGINNGNFRSTSKFMLVIGSIMALIVLMFGYFLYRSY